MSDQCLPPDALLPAIPEAQQVLAQVLDLVGQAIRFSVKLSYDRRYFNGHTKETKPGCGILALRGKLEDDVITMQLELVRAPEHARVTAASFFKSLSTLGEKTRIVPPVGHKQTDSSSLWVELGIQASVLSMSRASAFLNEVTQLDEVAKSLQYQLSYALMDVERSRLLKDFPDLRAVLPLHFEIDPAFLEWARATIDLLWGSASIAIAAQSSVIQDFALSALASTHNEMYCPIAKLNAANVNSKGLVDLIRRAPVVVAVPAVSITLGTNFYEMGNEIRAMLGVLSSLGKPAIFTGTYEELQSIFHGGQGGLSDPLTPIVRHVPKFPLDHLIRLAVRSAVRHIAHVCPAVEEELANEVKTSLNAVPYGEQIRILPVVTNRVVNVWNQSKEGAVAATAVYASQVSALSETFTGLSTKPRAQRTVETQERFVRTLADSQLLADLKDQLLGQDRALGQLVTRLRMEVLTRPLHQPIRYAAQGTPGTGKSESAQIIAQRLGVPHINIDAASIPDYYSAAAQLLGSGRGIVGSYQSGRLEQAAKHHTGALIEVSDLDHANERVRSGLADLFLQVLETGEAQSAAGAVFSCANLIFAFTMNLPDGLDEAVRKEIGFQHEPSRDAITSRVMSEIAKMLSSAFLSRIGTPILFDPLDSDTTAAILQRAIRAAVIAAAERLHLKPADVIVEPNVGVNVLTSLRTKLESFGARAALEHGRSLAASAVLQLTQQNLSTEGMTLLVLSNQDAIEVSISPS